MELDFYPILELLPNFEPKSESLSDLCLESQIRLLEYLKSWKDCEKGKIKGKGFANASILNSSRNPSVFTNAEAKSAEIFDAFGLRYVHELRFSGKDSKNRTHHYKLDFFFPESRINVEISPDFHKSYKLVAIRDALRKRVLKKAGIRTLTVRVLVKRKNGHVSSVPDVARLRKVARLIKDAQKSRESLEYYLKGGE